MSKKKIAKERRCKNDGANLSIKWSLDETKMLGKLYPLYLVGEINKGELMGAFKRRTFVALQRYASVKGMNVANHEGAVNVDHLKKLETRLGVKLL